MSNLRPLVEVYKLVILHEGDPPLVLLATPDIHIVRLCKLRDQVNETLAPGYRAAILDNDGKHEWEVDL